MSEIKDRTVLITGGASGIGRLMAVEMAGLGGRIVIWDIDETKMQSAKKEIGTAGGSVFAFVCDLSDKAAIQRTAEQVKSEVGDVDILINNAGVVSGKRFMACTDEQIEQTIAINMMAHFWTIRAFLPAMLEKDRGHIVTISSAGGTTGVASLSNYSASKFAVFGLDESLRAEFKKDKRRIKTTIVCPYYINTGMFDGVKTRFPFILPILKEKKVAHRIVRAIRKNKPRLLMPWIVYTVPLLRILPVSWFDAISNFLGINSTMDEFTGRQVS